MTASQIKSVEILTPLLGAYLATKLATRLPAELVDKLASEIRRYRDAMRPIQRRSEDE